MIEATVEARHGHRLLVLTDDLRSLAAVTRQVVQGAPTVVAHQSQLPAVSISFNLAKGVALSQAKPLIDAAAEDLGQPASISVSSSQQVRAYRMPRNSRLPPWATEVVGS